MLAPKRDITQTRHYSEGNDHRIGRVCVVRAFLAGSPGLAEASARQETSRIRDSVKRIEPLLGLEVQSEFPFSGARTVH